MSANRVSWIVAIVVVAVVGLLVVRTLQRDTSIRTASAERPARSETPPPHTSPSPSPPPVSSDSIRAALKEPGISSVQKAKLVLEDRGFYKGPIDGNYDPLLAEALKRFQAEQGMKATGYLDEKTYEALGIELRHKRP